MLKFTVFEEFLRRHSDRDWETVVNRLLPDIHPVDRRAVQIWFAFFPFALANELQTASDPKIVVRDLLLKGKFRLADQIDTSHEFLYGHRFWPRVKETIASAAGNAPVGELETVIRQTAKQITGEERIALGITAVGLMTLQQVGLELFKQPAKARIKPTSKSPEQILKERAKTEPVGFFESIFRTVDRRYTVRFNENDPKATYKAINLEVLTMAAIKDTRDYKARDARCVEGPIPIECQTGACGTCWVGILGGEENVNPISSFEVKRLGKIGYPYNGEERPPIRLACKTEVRGPLSIVIPPWNGVCEPLHRKLAEERNNDATERTLVES